MLKEFETTDLFMRKKLYIFPKRTFCRKILFSKFMDSFFPVSNVLKAVELCYFYICATLYIYYKLNRKPQFLLNYTIVNYNIKILVQNYFNVSLHIGIA